MRIAEILAERQSKHRLSGGEFNLSSGMWASVSGANARTQVVDTVANNLANVNTVGFKAQRLVSKQQEFADTLAGVLPGVPERAKGDQERTPGVMHIESVTDFSPGPVSFTGNPLHVAVSKENQFFVVQTPEGDMYTRAGNFQLNSEGTLVTADGKVVLGEGGQIAVTGSNAQITANGTVMVNGQAAGKLRVVEFEDTKGLDRREGTRFVSKDGNAPAAVTSAYVIPQSLEMANVSVVGSMVDMISAQKSFESYAKSIQTINELNETSLRTARSQG